MAVGGSVAYVAQQAWIVNDTLKNNVLFGKPYESHRWYATTEACSLISDLAVRPFFLPVLPYCRLPLSCLCFRTAGVLLPACISVPLCSFRRRSFSEWRL